jgi:hypothetical protein
MGDNRKMKSILLLLVVIGCGPKKPDGAPEMRSRTTDGFAADFELGDKDGDGIVDGEDRCIDEPEDMDGDADLDGCPDEDPAAPESDTTPESVFDGVEADVVADAEMTAVPVEQLKRGGIVTLKGDDCVRLKALRTALLAGDASGSWPGGTCAPADSGIGCDMGLVKEMQAPEQRHANLSRVFKQCLGTGWTEADVREGKSLTWSARDTPEEAPAFAVAVKLDEEADEIWRLSLTLTAPPPAEIDPAP